MIRKRVARFDDPMIYKFIVEELVPKTATGFYAEYHGYEAIRKRLNHNVTFVASKPMQPLQGFISIQPRGSTIFIDMLAVSPSQRGNGLGKQFMQTAERYGGQRGCLDAQLYVDDSNGHAFAFYRRLGYQPFQYMSTLRCYAMYKRL